MKMSDVRVGMRLRGAFSGELVTVTELTPRGFKYSLDAPKPFVPRWGWTFEKDGHEHFGFDGEAFYEPADTAPSSGDPRA